MVSVPVQCPHCHSSDVIKAGRQANGAQRSHRESIGLCGRHPEGRSVPQAQGFAHALWYHPVLHGQGRSLSATSSTRAAHGGEADDAEDRTQAPDIADTFETPRPQDTMFFPLAPHARPPQWVIYEPGGIWVYGLKEHSYQIGTLPLQGLPTQAPIATLQHSRGCTRKDGLRVLHIHNQRPYPVLRAPHRALFPTVALVVAGKEAPILRAGIAGHGGQDTHAEGTEEVAYLCESSAPSVVRHSPSSLCTCSETRKSSALWHPVRYGAPLPYRL